MKEDNLINIFDALKTKFVLLQNQSLHWRFEQLKMLESFVTLNQENIAAAIYEDFKKPITETLITEIYPLLSEIRHTIAHLHTWTERKDVETPLSLLGSSSYLFPEPKGVVLIISPWNYPFLLAMSPLVSAIAAGNTAIIKPSELSPNTSNVILQTIAATFSPDICKVVLGDAETAKSLLELPFDHIFFTGSTQVGRNIMLAAAKNLTSVTLELGGKSPVIITDSADLDDAVKKIVWGKFINAGQTCIAPDYLLVHEKFKTEIIPALIKQVEKIYQSAQNSIENSDSFAHIISDRHHERLMRLMYDAKEKGAKISFHEQAKNKTRYFSPTIITDVNENMLVMQEEIFGPILPVIFYSNESEALAWVNKKLFRNDIGKPLASYIFTTKSQDKDFWQRNLSTGGICFNECILHISNPNLPFGGIGKSGLGKSHGIFGFREFSNHKAVFHQRIGFTSAQILYPPYTEKIKKLVNLLMKWL